MMWMSFIVDGNIQEMKQLVIEHKALKWVTANSALLKGSPWLVPTTEMMTVTSPSQLQWL